MRITSGIWLGLGVLFVGSMAMASNGSAETKPETQFLYRLQPARVEMLQSGPTPRPGRPKGRRYFRPCRASSSSVYMKGQRLRAGHNAGAQARFEG